MRSVQHSPLLASVRWLLAASLALGLASGAAQAQALASGVYRGDDGSTLYVQQNGPNVFAFAEHPGRKYALVARGTREGNQLQLDWWDVPKGSRQLAGRVELELRQAGRALQTQGGDGLGAQSFERVAATQGPWPVRLAAGFQASGVGNLTGAYNADDHSRWYLRAIGNTTVGVVEAAAQPNERPAFVSVFIGTKSEGDSSNFSGTWQDVPKGLQTRSGRIGVAQLTPATAIWNRELRISQTGVTRARAAEPDYAIDFQALAERIEQVMGSSGAVGWAYAIATPAGVVRKGAGGKRQLKVDGADLPFTARTLAQVASVSKTVTAIALARALHRRGLSFKTPIRSFIPPCWKPGQGIEAGNSGGMSFGDLASHQTGFDDVGGSDYERVKRVIENGNVREPSGFKYENANYRVMRYLVPMVADKNRVLAIFNRWGCKDSNGEQINKEVSKLFAQIVLRDTFPPSISAGMDFVPTTGDFSRNYNWQDASVAGSPPNPNAVEKAGAGYLALSAESAVMMLRALDAGEIVPVAWARAMKQERYGFDNWFDTRAGRAAWKNGGCPTSDDGKDCAAWVVVFPGHVFAYLVINSGRKPPNGNDNANLGAILRSSYDAAFIK